MSTPTAMLANLTHPCSGAFCDLELLLNKEKLTGFLPTSSENSQPHHMVLESLYACDDDGRGNGVSSNNPLASMFLGANKIWIVFDWLPYHAANENAYPWLLCALVEHVSWRCCPLSNCLFGQVAYGPFPLKYCAPQPLFVRWFIMPKSRLRPLRTWPI